MKLPPDEQLGAQLREAWPIKSDSAPTTSDWHRWAQAASLAHQRTQEQARVRQVRWQNWSSIAAVGLCLSTGAYVILHHDPAERAHVQARGSRDQGPNQTQDANQPQDANQTQGMTPDSNPESNPDSNPGWAPDRNLTRPPGSPLRSMTERSPTELSPAELEDRLALESAVAEQLLANWRVAQAEQELARLNAELHRNDGVNRNRRNWGASEAAHVDASLAATWLCRYADRLAVSDDLAEQKSAAVVYRQVARTYPNTVAGQRAYAKLTADN